jgi:predicted ATPase
MAQEEVILTPDQRLHVFVSSTLRELAPERQAVRDAVTRLRLVPVMFELGARPHPPREVYRAYLAQSQVFVGVYWQSYGWIAPGEQVSGLEDEYLMAASLPRLLYVKSPAPEREPRLAAMLDRIREAADVSYQHFSTPADLQRLVENDLAQLLSERFEMAHRPDSDAMRAAGMAETLPEPATPLVGRDQEAEAISDLVVREGVRLVTLTGPGGVGKSRLAVEAARRLASGFREGVRFVDLSAIPAADLVAATIATGLGLSTSGGRLLSDLESYLHSRQLLLLLDNFEQVTGAAPLVTTLLGAAPGVVALVTSRMVLRLSGEHEFPVPTLPVPQAGTGEDLATTRQYASVRLFAERAHAAAADFELTSDNAGAVAEICRRLDGLPLAIELAAARIRVLPPQALLARIGDRLGLLTDGARDLPERQRTLRNTLDWSFDLLSAPEQALFGCLGVFAGTFDLRAVAAVSGDSASSPADPGQAGQVIDTLSSLVDSSLVRQEARSGEPRFRLLETIQEYALQRLGHSARWTEAHDRHAAYFLALAEPTAAEMTGRGQLGWLDRLEAEHDNLWAAMSWLVDSDIESAMRLFWVTWRFWWLHGHPAELAGFEEKFAAGSEHLPPYQHALTLTGAGFMLLANEDQAGAEVIFEQSLRLYRQSRDSLSVVMTATVLGVLGRIGARHGHEAEAVEQLNQSQVLLAETDDGGLAGDDRAQYMLTVALVHNFLGQIRLSQGDLDSATQYFREGLKVGRSASDRVSILISLYDLAMSSQAAGELAGATGFLREGLSVAAEAGDETSVAYYLEGLAAVAGQQDNSQRAVRLLSAAAAMRQAKGSGWLHAYVPRAAYDDGVLAVLRSRLGDAAFAQAWAWGESTGGRNAVDYALEAPAQGSVKPIAPRPL